MKTIIKLFTLIALLFAGNTFLYAQPSVYVIEDETVTVTKNADTFGKYQNAVPAFAKYLDKNGYIKGTFFHDNADSHAYADMETPKLHDGAFSEIKAKIHIDIRYENGFQKVSVTCNEIIINFTETGIIHQYNPATNYPVSTFYKAANTMISADDAKATFNKLTQYMNKVAADILKGIKDYEPGNKV